MNRRIDILLFGLTSFLCSFYVFHENLKIAFGPIDDHEIVRFLGSDKQLWIWQIPSTLVEMTEVGQYGQYPRFRPVYYVLRMTESSIYGVDSTNWYLARIFMISLTAFFLLLGLMHLFTFRDRLVSILFGLWLTLSVISLSSWQDIVSRLGPGEIYLVLEISIFFYLASALVIRNFSLRLWILISATFIAAVGTKENGISLLLPYVLIYVYLILANVSRRVSTLIVFSSSLLISALIAIGWVLGTVNNSGDVYGNERGLDSAITHLFTYTSGAGKSKELLFMFSIIVIHVVISQLTRNPLTKGFFFIVLTLFSIYAMIAAEQIFYQGDFSTLRYAAVSLLLSTLGVAIAVVLLLNTFWMLNFSDRLKKAAVILSLSVTLVIISIPKAQVAKVNFDSVAAQGQLGAENFQTQLTKVREDLSSGKFNGIVLQISNVWDYEPAYAFSQYLEFYGNGLPKYLHVTEFNVAPGLETKLLMQLMDYETNGESTWNIQPRRELPSDSVLYCVTVNQAPVDSGFCDN